MSGMKEAMRIGLVSIILASLFSLSTSESNDEAFEERNSYGSFQPFDGRIQYLLEAKRSVSGIKNLIDELHDKLEKRTACMLDGGLSASCNHKDAVEAGEHHRFLASSFAPGRRKRGYYSTFTENSNGLHK